MHQNAQHLEPDELSEQGIECVRRELRVPTRADLLVSECGLCYHKSMNALAIALSVLMGIQAIFQALLAAGVPWGRAAWGGQHEVLPTGFRIGSVFSALFFVFAILAALSRGDVIGLFTRGLTTVFFWIYTIYFGIGIVMNAVSRSRIERVWAPFAAVMFVLSLLLLIRG